MTLSTHTAIGAAIGFTVGNPVLGFCLGFVSHLLVDIIPHGDHALAIQMREDKKIGLPVTLISLDAFIAMFIALFFFNTFEGESKLALTAAIAGSIMPDFLVGVFDVTKTKYLRWFNRLHFWFHDMIVARHKDIRLTYSIVLQLTFIALVMNIV